MGKAIANTALGFLGGRIDNWVYRNTGDGIVVSKRPRRTAAASEAQIAVQRKFKAASAYAKRAMNDPALAARYAAGAASVGQRPFARAVADFLKSPVVEAINAAGYHGAAGDVILVRATDDFEVTGVTVAIRDAANAVLEQGVAVLVDGEWRYTATTAIAAGTAVTIEAVAKDRPGHEGSLQVPLAVA
jgi:hypothetical protein